jgi:hypothetical protein
VGEEFQANTYTEGEQSAPAIAVDGQGDNFVVAWASQFQDGPNGAGVYARRLRPADNPPAVKSATFVYDSGSVQRLKFSFDQDVANLAASDVRVVNLVTGATANPTGFTYDRETFTARFTLPANLPNGDYRATIPAGAVSDASGNGIAAAYTLDFWSLTGDVNRDRAVNSSDFALLAGAFGETGASYGRGDLNGDGAVNTADFTLLAANFGKSLPPRAVTPAVRPAQSLAPAPLMRRRRAPGAVPPLSVR